MPLNKELTTGNLVYREVLEFLKPFINKKLFTVMNKPTDKYGKVGIVAGKLVWNVDKQPIKVFVGKSEGKFLFIPYEDRFAEEQCLMMVQKQIGKVFRVLRYVKVMQYKGKTSIELSNGVVDVHNYYIRRPKQKKPSMWTRIRDILEVINEDTGNISGLYATSEEGQQEIINMFPDFARYDVEA